MVSIRRTRPHLAQSLSRLGYQMELPEAQARHILEEIVWAKEVEVARLRQGCLCQNCKKRY
jgi:indole-3-glycerol phosphate synthase